MVFPKVEIRKERKDIRQKLMEKVGSNESSFSKDGRDLEVFVGIDEDTRRQ